MIIDDNCNKDVGIFHIEYLCDYKSNDGHKLYHIRCKECGYESNRRYNEILTPKNCRHKATSGNYINKNIKWKDKRLQHIFNGMRSRCYDIKNPDYKFYGKKGIKIYDKWLINPIEFEKWSLNNGYQNNLTIDRIDSNKDYCPENCRWITIEENSRYKSTTNLITVNGITKSGRQWSSYLGYGINYINTYVRKYGIDKTKEFILKSLNI